MAEFCKCGSLVLNGKCTNKSCSFRKLDGVTHVKELSAKKAAKGEKAPAKSTRTRKSSKCITYNLYETNSDESPESAE